MLTLQIQSPQVNLADKGRLDGAHPEIELEHFVEGLLVVEGFGLVGGQVGLYGDRVAFEDCCFGEQGVHCLAF